MTTDPDAPEHAAMACPVCGAGADRAVLRKDGFVVRACPRDGHLFTTPVPTAEELRALYGRAYWTGSAIAGYRHNAFTDVPRQQAKARRKLRRVLRLRRGGRLLDVGCGPGYFLALAAAHFDADGLDISQEAVQHARERFGVSARVGNLLTDDFPHAPYDLLTMFSYLEHTPDPRAHLRRAHALLQPGGLLAIAVPNAHCLWRYLRGADWRGFSFPEHLHFFSPPSLRALLLDTGFTPLPTPWLDRNPLRDTVYYYAQR